MPKQKTKSKTTTSTNQIGLNTAKCAELASSLNDLLANYHVFYQNMRGFHWNLKGDNFFELHAKFEELYNDLVLKIDEIAERILTLGHKAENNFSHYLAISEINEAKEVHDGKTGLSHALDALKTIISKQRVVLELSADAEDEGTNALMSDYIAQQEKTVWMYASYLGK